MAGFMSGWWGLLTCRRCMRFICFFNFLGPKFIASPLLIVRCRHAPLEDSPWRHPTNKVPMYDRLQSGFQHIIDLLTAENKLIEGHNCFLGMTHMYHKFFGPLPSTLEEFALDFRESSPHIVGMKVLLNADASLQKLVNKTSTLLASSFYLLCPKIAFGEDLLMLVHALV